ncbi:MAG: hypothetical protein MUF14_05690 [Hyphomonadaceae bacterium]|nr:hypothetical protein [Hyphomonadaceae bacterium]
MSTARDPVAWWLGQPLSIWIKADNPLEAAEFSPSLALKPVLPEGGFDASDAPVARFAVGPLETRPQLGTGWMARLDGFAQSGLVPGQVYAGQARLAVGTEVEFSTLFYVVPNAPLDAEGPP